MILPKLKQVQRMTFLVEDRAQSGNLRMNSDHISRRGVSYRKTSTIYITLKANV